LLIQVPVTMRAAQYDHSHQAVPSDLTLRVKALESLAGLSAALLMK
jgi:hypothetical protein